MSSYKFNPNLDLVLEKTLDIPVEKVYQAWTTPSSWKEWFCPKPWSVSEVVLDLRPGGEISFVMHGPEGEMFPSAGCVLEVVPNQKLVWTDAMSADYRPKENGFFTAMIMLERDGNKTKYTAIGIHKNEEDRKKHEAMGFQQGWGIVVDQLVAYMKNK